MHNTVHRLPSSCCAAFALGTTSGTACPASYARLDTAVACKSAADAARKAYTDVAYLHYPYGCYWHTITGSVYYNSNASGAANFYAQPLCAGAALLTHINTDRHCAGASHAWTPRRCGGNGADVQPCRRYA